MSDKIAEIIKSRCREGNNCLQGCINCTVPSKVLALFDGYSSPEEVEKLIEDYQRDIIELLNKKDGRGKDG